MSHHPEEDQLPSNETESHSDLRIPADDDSNDSLTGQVQEADSEVDILFAEDAHKLVEIFKVLSIASYENQLCGPPLEILTIADTTESMKLFCVNHSWASLRKGYVYNPSIHCLGRKLLPNGEEECRKRIIQEKVPVGTHEYTIRLPATMVASGPNKSSIRTRGGRSAASCRRGTKENDADVCVRVIITWKRYRIKAILKDYCEYI